MGQESIAALYDEFPDRPAEDRASIEAEADEGLLLAEYATRMRLKNRIVVDVLTGTGEADPDAWIEAVRLSLGSLRLEAEASARRMAAERDAAEASGGLPQHQHDYRHRDAANLERRRRVYTALVRRLLRWENDDARVRELLAAARDDAYREMRSAVTATLDRPRAEDRELLEDRLRLVASVDLPALAGRPDRDAAAEGREAEQAHAGDEDGPADSDGGRPGLLGRLGPVLHRRR